MRGAELSTEPRIRMMEQRSAQMKGYEELSFLDATALAELVRKKQVQAGELVEAAVERIKKINPQINAVVNLMDDEARRIVRGHLPDGPFTSIPSC